MLVDDALGSNAERPKQNEREPDGGEDRHEVGDGVADDALAQRLLRGEPDKFEQEEQTHRQEHPVSEQDLPHVDPVHVDPVHQDRAVQELRSRVTTLYPIRTG